MQEKLRLEQIEKAIEDLTPQEQLRLVEKIIHNLKHCIHRYSAYNLLY